MVGTQANYNPPDRRPRRWEATVKAATRRKRGHTAARNRFGVRLSNVGHIMHPVWR